MRVNDSFSAKLETIASQQIESELEKFSGYSACAGIEKDEDNAYKASVNHWGVFGSSYWQNGWRIPPRQFIQNGIKQGDIKSDAIKEAIIEGINENASPRSQKTTPTVRGGRIIQVASNIKRETPLFRGRDKYITFFKNISKIMAENQFAAIIEQTYDGIHHNTPSTIAQKGGKDFPLTDTDSMAASIHGWVGE